MVPFSKYTSWCTSRMSPYFDLRWQRKGLCRTSTFTSASGSFPPLTDTSRVEQSQLSTVSSMLPPQISRNSRKDTQITKVSEQMCRSSSEACGCSSTWQFHHTCCCRKSFSDWLLFLINPAHRRPTLASSERGLWGAGLIFIGIQCFMKFTVMQANYPFITRYWIHFDVTEQFVHAAAIIKHIFLAVVAVWHSFSTCRSVWAFT